MLLDETKCWLDVISLWRFVEVHSLIHLFIYLHMAASIFFFLKKQTNTFSAVQKFGVISVKNILTHTKKKNVLLTTTFWMVT